jgi:hypothetical protein
MFVHVLFKPSIWLEEDSLEPALGALPGEGRPTPASGILPGKGDLAPTLKADLGTLAGPISQVWEPETEIMAITGPLGNDTGWWKQISGYLWLGRIPDDETETRRLACRSKGYLMHDGELYHHSTSSILKWCISVEEGKALLLDIHVGACGHHISSRSMVRKAFWQGFYWPMAASYAAQIMRSGRGCKFFARQIHALAQELQTIPITWLFAMWGMDLLGPFKKALKGLTHLLVAVDKFTKWTEDITFQDWLQAGSKCCLGHYLLFRGAKLNHHRQWYSVNQGDVPRFL